MDCDEYVLLSTRDQEVHQIPASHWSEALDQHLDDVDWDSMLLTRLEDPFEHIVLDVYAKGSGEHTVVVMGIDDFSVDEPHSLPAP